MKKKQQALVHSVVFLLLNGISFFGYSQLYFQQQVNYTIHVKLDDTHHLLIANEEIAYTNNSPNELTEIWFHLWPNGYKNESTAFAKQEVENGSTRFYFSKEEERGWIDSLNFKSEGKTLYWEYDKKLIDACKVVLNKPLKSRETITITTPFVIKIPLGVFSRLGHLDQSYFISQWYPKPAVYDANGWNVMPYLNQGEFYSEFGSFDVFITLPKNYVVGSTGDLVDGKDEIQWLNVKAKQTEKIKSFDEKDLSIPPSNAETKTLHYHQDNIHDFAWFADKRFHVLKGEVELPITKRKVTTWAMFTNLDASLWTKSIFYINDAIYYYSLWNGEYPYNQATALQGALTAGGGMEYPNVTIISSATNDFMLEQVIMHEVGHNWFYGILGSNERKHPWMDEGINSFYESRYIQTKYPDLTLMGAYNKRAAKSKMFGLNKYKQGSLYYLAYLFTALKHEDQAIELASDDYNQLNYGAIVYFKSAAVIDYLRNYLGDDTFDKAMHLYFDEWKFKHPQPNNVRKIFESTSGKDLSWFFDDIIKTNKQLDYKIVKCKKVKDPLSWSGIGYDITLKNKGQIAAPFSLSGVNKNEILTTEWYDGFKHKKIVRAHYIDPRKVKIDAGLVMTETNRKNNFIRTKGIFRKLKPPKLQFLSGVDDPENMQLFWCPIIGWNKYDHVMPGIALYNNPLFQKKLDYVVAPMYSTKTSKLSGMFNAGYNWFADDGFIHDVRLGVSGKQFSFANDLFDMHYKRIVPSLKITFRPKTPRSPIIRELIIRNVNVFRNEIIWNLDADSNYVSSKTDSSYFVNEIKYSFNHTRVINPYSFSIVMQQSKVFVNASLEANYRITYNSKNRGLDIRFFSGYFISKKPSYYDFRYQMSGYSGSDDLLLDQTYFGRSENKGLLSQQFIESDGAFKINTPYGDTWNWMTALNLKTSLPGRTPFVFYADIGTYDGAGKPSSGTEKIIYNAGIDIIIARGIFEIYFPLFLSADLKDYVELNKISFMERIRFTLNINKLNPFDIVKRNGRII